MFGTNGKMKMKIAILLAMMAITAIKSDVIAQIRFNKTISYNYNAILTSVLEVDGGASSQGFTSI